MLALAYKDIPGGTKLKDYTREQAERDLIFTGFVVYESPLKGDTMENID